MVVSKAMLLDNKAYNLWADILDAVYFSRGLMCTLGLTNDLIDSGEPRAKSGF